MTKYEGWSNRTNWKITALSLFIGGIPVLAALLVSTLLAACISIAAGVFVLRMAYSDDDLSGSIPASYTPSVLVIIVGYALEMLGGFSHPLLMGWMTLMGWLTIHLVSILAMVIVLHFQANKGEAPPTDIERMQMDIEFLRDMREWRKRDEEFRKLYPELTAQYEGERRGQPDYTQWETQGHSQAEQQGQETTKQRTPLHVAVLNGDTEIALVLISGGADVNAKNDSGKTLLHISAGRGYTEIALALIKNGADVNAKDDMGNTPLYDALVWNHSETADAIIKHGGVLRNAPAPS